MSTREQRRRRLDDAGIGHKPYRDQVHRKLGACQAVLRGILESSAVGIIVLNNRGTVLEFNAAAQAIYGLAKSAVVGTHIDKYVSSQDFRKSGIEVFHLLQSQKETPAENRWQTSVVGSSGKATDVELAVSRTETREGLMVTLFIQDIGETRKAARKLQQERERAEKATDAKSRYLATMSHEIRTPLSAILGSLDLLAESTLTAEQQQLLEAARLSGRSVKNVTDDIIDLSKIESGHLQLNDAPFDLMMLVDDMAHSIAPGAYAKGLEIALSIDADVPRYLIGDMRRLQQILLNLLTNAVKFTSEGAVILHLAARFEDNHLEAVRFSIADTGIGIPNSSQGRLFKEFFRGGDLVEERFQGSGLGLAISKRLVSAMGGQVGVDSTEGEGSRFWFHVKLREDPAPPRFTDEKTGKAKRYSVIVQRNSLVAESMRRQLAAWGDEAMVMPSPKQAFNFIARQRTDVRKISTLYLDAELAQIHGDEIVALQADCPNLDLAILVRPGARKLDPLLEKIRPSVCLAKPIRLTDLWLYNVARENFQRREDRIDPSTTLKGLKRLSESVVNYGARILVAEDSEVNQMVVRAMLESENYIVDVVSNGIEAVIAATKSPYDLILMDLTMPDKDGVQAAVEIRQQLNTACPPIIAMTGNAFDEDRVRCQRAGMTAFMIKPVDKRQLIRNVAAALHGTERIASGPSSAGERNSAGTIPKGSRYQSVGLIDNGVLESLREQIGESNARTAIRQFAIEAGDLVTQLMSYKGDIITRKRAAHTLKSVAATFGVRKLQAIASEMEQAFEAGDRRRIAVLTHQLEEISEQLHGEFRALAMSEQRNTDVDGETLADDGE